LAEGGIVLIKLLAADENGEGRPLLPIDGYRYRPDGAMTDMAFANLATDPDGVVRTFVPVLFGDGTAEELIFGTLLAVRASGQDPAAPKWRFGGETVEHSPHFKEIGFSGPPGTIPRIRFEKLLAPGAENDPHVASLVSDKVVIIAGEHVGSQDVHLTPYSSGIFGSESRLMKGAEIHANVVETLLSGRRPKNAPLWLCVAVSLIFITAGTAVFIRLNAWRGLATGVVMITALPFISLLLFATGIFVPAIGTQVALVVSFLSTMGLRLTGEERERARLRKIFGNYVSHEVVEKLLASGRHPDLGGEESHVTVLFSDIRNFTTISERLGPHEVVEMLNTYFSRAVEPILEQGGTVDKFIGDAIMAVFGEPANYPDHARRALLAALKMADNAREFRGWMNERFAGRNLPEFNIGIGLHTGPAVSGNVGSPRRMQYTVIGDTVNTASRLESKTKELGVMILASAATVQAAGAGVETGLKSTLTVKGKDEPVEVCEIKSLY
jgi:class 3 adenylate cyclase